MLRVRYPLLAFATLAVVVVGYTFLVGRATSRTVRELAYEDAEKTAAFVAQVARANEEVLRDVRRRQHNFDEIAAAALAAQVEAGDRLRSRRSILQRWMARLFVDRAVLVGADGAIVIDEQRVARPGKRDPSPLDAIETSEIVAAGKTVAAGGAPPAEKTSELYLRKRVYQRIDDGLCLVLVRSEATIRELSLETAMPRLLHVFRDDATVARVAIVDRNGGVVAEQRGRDAAVTLPFTRPIGGGDFTLEIEINLDRAREVEERAFQMPFLIGLALLAAGALSMLLVFRLQHAHLAREAELRARSEQDRRLASLGRLTAGVAHEIKNPLNAIGLSVSRLERRLGEEDRPILEAITVSARSITRTVEDFMKLARDPQPAFEEAAPGDVLQEAAEQVRPMADELARELVIEPSQGSCRLDRARLREALVNLLRNGLQASRSRVEARLTLRDGCFRFEVDDDGPGVPKESRREILDFFYTTKPEGTGLGLPLAHRVAEEHDGSLEIGEAPLGGARFTLTVRCR